MTDISNSSEVKSELKVADQIEIVPSDTLDVVADDTPASVDTITIIPQKEAKPVPEIAMLGMGKTLRLLALEKYGHREFWIYIYMDNKDKIPNPNNVPVGVKLKIPPKAKYGIDARNPQSVQKAIQLGRTEMSKFT